jgi:hypothetical protein
MTEAFPWDTAPKHLVQDRDDVYGHVVRRRLRGLGIRDLPTAPRSPWQNAHATVASKDAPISRPIEQIGRVIAEPMLGGLHHDDARS